MESDAESGNTENIDLDYLRQVLMDTKDQIDITMMGE
jgi:hypothetical protein